MLRDTGAIRKSLAEWRRRPTCGACRVGVVGSEALENTGRRKSSSSHGESAGGEVAAHALLETVERPALPVGDGLPKYVPILTPGWVPATPSGATLIRRR